MRFPKPLLLAALCLQATALQAQQYRRTPGDTLYYRETSKQTTQSTTPNGPITVGVTSSGLISIAFLRGDSARVWYDSVDAKIDSQMGDLGGDFARQLVKKPFVLRFLRDGQVQTVSFPAIESPGGPMTLQNAFHEWFPKLPARMDIGTVWQDTLNAELSPAPGMTTKSTAIRRYRIARDSTVSGMRVFVIETTSTTESSSNGNMGGVSVSTTLKGELTGVILFAPNPGLVVGRTMQGKMDGSTEMSGRMTMSMPQHTEIEARVELIRK